MKKVDKPKRLAIDEDPSTNMSAPLIKKIKPIIK